MFYLKLPENKPTRQKLYSIFRQVSDYIWEYSVKPLYNPFQILKLVIHNRHNQDIKGNSETVSPNCANFSRNELVNFPTKFGVKFTTSFTSSQFD